MNIVGAALVAGLFPGKIQGAGMTFTVLHGLIPGYLQECLLQIESVYSSAPCLLRAPLLHKM